MQGAPLTWPLQALFLTSSAGSIADAGQGGGVGFLIEPALFADDWPDESSGKVNGAAALPVPGIFPIKATLDGQSSTPIYLNEPETVFVGKPFQKLQIKSISQSNVNNALYAYRVWIFSSEDQAVLASSAPLRTAHKLLSINLQSLSTGNGDQSWTLDCSRYRYVRCDGQVTLSGGGNPSSITMWARDFGNGLSGTGGATIPKLSPATQWCATTGGVGNGFNSVLIGEDATDGGTIGGAAYTYTARFKPGFLNFGFTLAGGPGMSGTLAVVGYP